MISTEFRTTISAKNLLKARIMLKDSLIVDPTFEQFNEMLGYAKSKLSNLFVPFDGERLENDRTKWNEALMNKELVGLVTNFSEERVSHLKEVIAKVLEVEVEEIRSKRECSGRDSSSASFWSSANKKFDTVKKKIGNREASTLEKESARKDALRRLEYKAQTIHRVAIQVESQGEWTSANVAEIERAAEDLLRAVRDYKNNR